MATKWTSVCFWMIICCIFCVSSEIEALEVNPIHYPDSQCYNSELRIGKSTLATTDSYRDTENLMLIFPEATLEYIPHFTQDLCARASKVWLPYTCFKLHQPQTWELGEGYLSVQTLEREFSKKFYAVIHGHSAYNFDSFFDTNVAFWVENLEKYLKQINMNHEILTHYLGLKWYHEDLDKTFYSLIIQSPGSQRVIELISFNKPDISSYHRLRDDFKWRETAIPRASFKQYPEGEYPWTGYLGTITKLGHPVQPDIVPIKLSYSTADIDADIHFYTNIMEAEVLEMRFGVVDTLDSVHTSYAFIQPVNSLIEIQYIERPSDYTYGKFTSELYKKLVVDTHNDRISSLSCGIDRWFDNHYGYDTTKFMDEDPKYMDRVLGHIKDKDLKYRLYYVDHQRDTGYYDSDEYDEGDLFYKYRMIVFDSQGQSIQMIGDFMDTQIEEQPPIYNKQWCAVPCPHNEPMGVWDWKRLKDPDYVEDENDIVFQILYGDTLNDHNGKKPVRFIDMLDGGMLVIIISVGLMIISSILYCIYQCYKWNGNHDRHHQIHDQTQHKNNKYDPEETRCLLPKS